MVVFTAMLAACGTDPHAGGGATETGNGIAYSIVTDSGKPAARAQVVFVRTDSWLQDVERDGSPQMFGVQADSAGVVRTAKPPFGTWAIQADRGGLSGWCQIPSNDTVSDTLRLAARTLVQGALSGEAVDQVWIAGTAWNSPIGAGGRYLLNKAAGRYAIVGASRGPVLALSTGSSPAGESSLQDLVARRDRVVVEDFLDGDRKTTLHAFTGIGNWYLAKDAGSKVWSSYDSTGPDFRGAFSMQYALKDSLSYIMAGISFVASDGYHKLNLAPMDSFCFELRGSGKVWTYFQEIHNQSVKRSVNALAGSMDTVWRRHCLKPKDFGSGWDSLKANTNDISFSPREGAKLEIRQIEFWGPTLLDLSVR